MAILTDGVAKIVGPVVCGYDVCKETFCVKVGLVCVKKQEKRNFFDIGKDISVDVATFVSGPLVSVGLRKMERISNRPSDNKMIGREVTKTLHHLKAKDCITRFWSLGIVS